MPASFAIKWVAELAHVHEVSLFGTADLAYWRNRLANETLVPAEKEGKAQIIIVAAAMRFMAIPFREVSISVLVSPPKHGTWREASFLVQAFNSCRFFAFWERAFFSTPYDYADARVSASVPCSIQLVVGDEVILRAEMQADARTANRASSRAGDETWEGPIFIPGRGHLKHDQRRAFFGKLQGHTRRCPFQPASDSLTIRPSPDGEILQALIDSHFAAEEWVVRSDARHAKSKTYRRSEVYAEPAHT